MARVLLLAPTTAYQTDDFTAAAARAGVELVLGTDRCHVLAEVWPEGALALDFRHPERALEVIAHHHLAAPLDGVIGVDETTATLAALAALRLGLPANPIEAARAAADKHALRRALTAAGLPQPRFGLVTAAAEVDPGLRFPVVVKPLHLSGSRGVMRADDPAALAERIARLRRLLDRPEIGQRDPEASARILVEEFVPGPEVAFEGLLAGGRLHTLAIFDKPDPLDGPFFAETLYVTPSRHPAPVQERIAAAVTAAAAALGLREGPVHAELRIAGDQVVVIELAARAIGGLCGRVLRFGAGLSLEEVLLAHAAGQSPGSLEREAAAGGVYMLPPLEAGVLRAVEGTGDARAVPGVRDVVITARVGDVLEPLPEGHAYLGFVFGSAGDPAAVEAALREAAGRLRFRVAARLTP